MVNITEITVGESRKINIGNYESKEISIYLKANVANQEIRSITETLNLEVQLFLTKKEKEIRSKAEAKP